MPSIQLLHQASFTNADADAELKILKNIMEIQDSFWLLGFTEETKAIKKIYRNMIYKKIREIVFKYLLEKQRSKGKNIIYEEFCITDYLLPNDNLNNIEDQRYIFAIRNIIINIT